MTDAVIIATPRCLLRAPVRDDQETLLRLIDQDMVVYTRLPWPYQPCHARYFLRKARKVNRSKKGFFAMVETRSGEVVGTVTLDPSREGVELGFWIATAFQSQGFATEAAQALLHYGQNILGCDAIYAVVVVDHVRSIAVLEKLGMHRASILMNAFPSVAGQRHCYLYQICPTI